MTVEEWAQNCVWLMPNVDPDSGSKMEIRCLCDHPKAKKDQPCVGPCKRKGMRGYID